MIYVMSDLHGCYHEYLEMLNKINFSQHDTLYILGDVVDRGPQPIYILKDMMLRKNVIPILGNHDFIAYQLLTKLNVEITAENVESYLDEETMLAYMDWIKDGGQTTFHQFQQLSRNERKKILDYFQEFLLYEEITVNHKDYVLVHAGLNHFEENKPLEHYHLTDFIFYRTDYHRIYYKNKYLITGHTPTLLIRDDRQPLIYQGNNHIAIDCGCTFGKRLACYCLDNQNVFYVDAKKDD